MLNERHLPWIPLEGVPDEVYLEALHDDYEGIRLLLRGAGNAPTFRLQFASVIAYRNINESFRARTWAAAQGGTRVGSLRRVESSRGLAWLVEESGGLLDAAKLRHYAVYTPEDCIDVVTEFEPEACWLNR